MANVTIKSTLEAFDKWANDHHINADLKTAYVTHIESGTAIQDFGTFARNKYGAASGTVQEAWGKAAKAYKENAPAGLQNIVGGIYNKSQEVFTKASEVGQQVAEAAGDAGKTSKGFMGGISNFFGENKNALGIAGVAFALLAGFGVLDIIPAIMALVGVFLAASAMKADDNGLVSSFMKKPEKDGPAAAPEVETPAPAKVTAKSVSDVATPDYKKNDDKEEWKQVTVTVANEAAKEEQRTLRIFKGTDNKVFATNYKKKDGLFESLDGLKVELKDVLGADGKIDDAKLKNPAILQPVINAVETSAKLKGVQNELDVGIPPDVKKRADEAVQDKTPAGIPRKPEAGERNAGQSL